MQPKIHIFLKKPLKKKMKRYSIGLGMTDDFDKSALCGVGKTEVRRGGLEK